jgi:hypothetical protein
MKPYHDSRIIQSRFYLPLLLVLLTAFTTGMVPVLEAATFTPGCPGLTNIDHGNALRTAIVTANANNQDDTISLTAGCMYDVSGSPGTLSIQSDSSHSLTIVGNRAFITGNNSVAVLSVGSGATVSISGVAILHGNPVFDNPGGGILNEGTLTLTNCSLRYNTTTADGGGIRNNGNLYLTNVVISGNQASAGGGLSNTGQAVLTRVTIGGSNSGDGNSGGGVQNIGGNLELKEATVSGNAAETGCAGVDLWSGGTAALTNVTIAANTTSADGGGLCVSNNTTAVTLTNVTISGNSANLGGGIYSYNKSDVKVKNSILAYNFGGNCALGMLSTITNEGNNLENGSACGWDTEKGSLSNIGPKLGNLTGSPAYFPLLPGSPAIDGVTYNDPNGCPLTDIRGVQRPQGPRCDLGAYEYVPAVYLPLVSRE